MTPSEPPHTSGARRLSRRPRRDERAQHGDGRGARRRRSAGAPAAGSGRRRAHDAHRSVGLVVGQEDLLEARMGELEVDDRVARERLDHGVERARPRRRSAPGSPSTSRSRTPGSAAKLGGVDGLGELDRHVAVAPPREVGDVLDGDEPPVADDRDAVAQALDLVEVVRGQEDRRAALALLGDDLVELLLHERVQAARRLVEDEQLRRVEERLDEADLLAVAAREVAERPVEVGVEALGELGRPAEPAQAAQRGEERHELAPGAPRVVGELARAGCRAGRGSRGCRAGCRGRTAARCRSSGAAGRAACGSSSSCRRRWARGSRTPRRAPRRARRPRSRARRRSAWSGGRSR